MDFFNWIVAKCLNAAREAYKHRSDAEVPIGIGVTIAGEASWLLYWLDGHYYWWCPVITITGIMLIIHASWRHQKEEKAKECS